MSEQEFFKKQRKQIMDDLPAYFKDMFGQIGFAPLEWVDDTGALKLPVLVLSPYDVPPKPYRDIYWFDKYSKAKRGKTLANMDYLVYHYGSDDPNDCYSFVTQSEFVPWHDGVAQGFDKLSPQLQSKSDSGAKLEEEEEFIVRAIGEMNEDLAKAPSERKRGQCVFQENHEIEDDDGGGGDYDDDDDDDSGGDDSGADDDQEDRGDGDSKPAAKKQKTADE